MQPFQYNLAGPGWEAAHRYGDAFVRQGYFGQEPVVVLAALAEVVRFGKLYFHGTGPVQRFPADR